MKFYSGKKGRVYSMSASRSRVDPTQLVVKIKFNQEFPFNPKPLVYEPLIEFSKAIVEKWIKWEQFDIEEDMADL